MIYLICTLKGTSHGVYISNIIMSSDEYNKKEKATDVNVRLRRLFIESSISKFGFAR